MRHLRNVLAVVVPLVALPACVDSSSDPVVDTTLSGGSLIQMNMSSRVAVLLDDIPAGPMREAAAANALAQPTQFWTDRARRQIRLTYYRLVFRGQYYASNWSSSTNVYGPLPLPDSSVWNVALGGAPYRDTSSGHDMIAVPYTFGSYIVTDSQSPGMVDPNLGTIGGATTEPFNLPSDPDLLLERTGFACMDEDEYPANSVFEENTWYFYDDSCVSGSQSCHITTKPQESCVEAIQKHSGIEKPAISFKRIAYDSSIADQYRVGEAVKPQGADLAVVQKAMTDEHRIVYKYFAPGSCELGEGVISKLGWRRLLTFSAVVQNDGLSKVHIGDPRDPSNPWVQSNAFEWSACHMHYHFSHYGNFSYNGAPGSKRAFCLEDTNRFHNDESTPLTAEHQTCNDQGIGAGWGDEYEFGIPGQWVDITDVDATHSHDLTFASNADQFMCEGTPYLVNNQPVFLPTNFVTAAGLPVTREQCTWTANWQANNLGTVAVSSPGGSYVTEACQNGQIGPNRNCGFSGGGLHTCQVGTTVNLTCQSKKASQVLRVCEKSGSLGVGVACALSGSMANQIVDGTATLSFPCPVDRDTGLGGYSVYNASIVPAQGGGTVTCSGTGW
jgi:hypothetical protein